MDNRPDRRLSGALASPLSLLALALAVAAAAPARAQEDMSRYYQATALVTGTDMRMRPTGFADCLRRVLVKLSGEPRLAKDPRVAELAAHADKLIDSFYYIDPTLRPVHDDQGTYDRTYYLTVGFEPALLDRALAALGERPWRGKRPVVIPALAVHGVNRSYLLSSDEPAAADQGVAFANVASDYGVKVRLPSKSEFDGWGVTMNWFPSPQISSTPDQVIVVGTLAFDPQLPGWVGSWRMLWQREAYVWGIKGVNYDAAFRDLVGGVLRLVSGHSAPE